MLVVSTPIQGIFQYTADYWFFFTKQHTTQYGRFLVHFPLSVYTLTFACLSLSFTRFERLIPLFKPFITQFDYSIAVITIFGMRLDIENAGYTTIWISGFSYHNTCTGVQCALPIKAYELHYLTVLFPCWIFNEQHQLIP